MADIGSGRYRARVRRIGYSPVDTILAFRPNETVEWHLILHNVVALDSVHVVAKSAGIPSFDDHQKIGLGRFLTRERLAKQEGRHLAEVLRELPSVVLDYGTGGRAWISSNRRPPSLGGVTVYSPEPWEARSGMQRRCYPKVYIDRQVVNQRRPNEPFDVNSISPDRIEAIEWYAGPSQTPPEYNNLNADCGVLVIWLRRSY